MEKELKIVVAIFSVFCIFGLSSLLSSGTFATPVFLQHFILVPLSVLFLILNFREKHKWLLATYVLVSLCALLIDDFSVAMISEKYQTNVLFELTTTLTFSVFFLVFYFGFFFYICIFFYLIVPKKLYLISSIILLSATVIALFLSQMLWLSGFLFLLFLLVHIIVYNKFSRQDSKVAQVLTYQFLLVILLQSLQYFL